MTGKIRIGVTEKGSLKNTRKRCISRSSKAVHNIKLPLTHSEFTVQMQSQLIPLFHKGHESHESPRIDFL